MTTPTFWNGEPCSAFRGSVIVGPDPRFKLYWALNLIGLRVPAVRVEASTGAFFILDHDDQGWAKVTVGRGSPMHGHRQITARAVTWDASRDDVLSDECIDAALEDADARCNADPRMRALLAARRSRGDGSLGGGPGGLGG